MKKNTKLLILSALVALIFSMSQAICGMDFLKNKVNAVVNNVKCRFKHEDSSNPDMIREIRGNPFDPKKCPIEIRIHILERAAIDRYLSYGNTCSLRLVCKDWRHIIEKKEVKESIEAIKSYFIPPVARGYEQIYERFLKGVLIYKPQEGSNDGMIEMRISDLANPLEGTFDLSQCGNAGEYLNISTGYPKEKREKSKGKVEIWFAPRFLIEKEINTTAKHFQEIFPKNWQDTAPIGIFWTCWKDDLKYYDYLTNQNMDELGKNNLYEKWRDMAESTGTLISMGWVGCRADGGRSGAVNFMFICSN